MIKRRAKKGLEDVEVLIKNKLDNLEEEIRKEFEARKTELEQLLLDVTEDYEVEIFEEGELKAETAVAGLEDAETVAETEETVITV